MSSLFNSGSHWQEQSQISSYIFSSDSGLCNAGFESSTHYVITNKDNDCCSKLSWVPSPWLTFKPNKLFSTVCGILYKKLTFSRSESSKQPEAHAPSQNSVYLTEFLWKASGFQSSKQTENPTIHNFSETLVQTCVNQPSCNKGPGITYLTTWFSLQIPTVFLEIMHQSKASQQKQSNPVPSLLFVLAWSKVSDLLWPSEGYP